MGKKRPPEGGKREFRMPEVTQLGGDWPSTIEAVKELLRNNEVPEEEIEAFILKIREARDAESDDSQITSNCTD